MFGHGVIYVFLNKNRTTKNPIVDSKHEVLEVAQREKYNGASCL